MHPRTLKIIAIVLLLVMFPATLAILLAILAHPAFLLLLLVCAFAIPFFRAVKS